MQGGSAHDSVGERLPGMVAMIRLLIPLAVSLTSAFAQTGFSIGSIDKSVAPCDNFYRFACGNWIKQNPIPGDQSRWGRFNELQDRNQRIVKDILETSGAKKDRSPVEQKIGDYYAACKDEASIEAKGISVLKPNLDRISALGEKAGLAELTGLLHRIGTGGLFNFYSRADHKNAKRTIAQADQGGLTLPDRDYYVRSDPKSTELRGQYLSHVQRMFELAGREQAEAAASAKTVLGIETALAKVSMDRVSRRNPNNTYHPTTRKSLLAATPSFDWTAYWKTIEVPSFEDLNLVNPEFFRGLEAFLTATPLDDIKTYLSWKHLHDSAAMLPSSFVQEDFNFFSKALIGAKELKPRWKRCVEAVDADLGEALGQKYVEVTFAGESKTRMMEMVRKVEAALETDIHQLDWMTPATKKRAAEKLHAISDKIGYPETWREYTFDVKAEDAIGNLQRANGFAFRRTLNKIGKAPDPKEWVMTPPTVNAYYSSQQNNINFPAGILQPPFFDPKLDDAVNYGGIGVVIGHELTHGFDDSGRRYDGQGNMSDWWTPEDAREFEKRAACIDRQYSGYTAVADVKLNGKLTLGENVADNGGARVAYMALLDLLKEKPQATIDGYTPEQRFFLGFAQVWCQNITDEASRYRAQVDPHSPGEYRVIGTLSNMPEFSKAWSCKAGEPMVRGDNACRVW